VPRNDVDFTAVRYAVQWHVPDLVVRWLADGRKQGNEWIARNPNRDDRTPGSFSVNLTSGAWADFATGDRGSDLISLAAYLFFPNHDKPQLEAARALSRTLGLTHD
jgi:hypothetical protein